MFRARLLLTFSTLSLGACGAPSPDPRPPSASLAPTEGTPPAEPERRPAEPEPAAEVEPETAVLTIEYRGGPGNSIWSAKLVAGEHAASSKVSYGYGGVDNTHWVGDFSELLAMIEDTPRSKQARDVEELPRAMLRAGWSLIDEERKEDRRKDTRILRYERTPAPASS